MSRLHALEPNFPICYAAMELFYLRLPNIFYCHDGGIHIPIPFGAFLGFGAQARPPNSLRKRVRSCCNSPSTLKQPSPEAQFLEENNWRGGGKLYVPWSRLSRFVGDGKNPTFNRNPYSGYINPYYWVDEFIPYYMEIMGVLTLAHMSSFAASQLLYSIHPGKFTAGT